MASLQQILSWFKTGLFPNESQFRETWLSFWHKSEKIPQTQIFGLQETIESATQGLIWKDKVTNVSDLATTYPNAQKGWAAMVTSVGYIYSYNGTAWANTGLTAFPADVATQDDVAQLGREVTYQLSQLMYDKYVNDGKFIGTAGNLGNEENFDATDFINLNNVESIYVEGYVNNTISILAFYDDDKTFLENAHVGTHTNEYVSLTLRKTDFPVDAKYVRHSADRNFSRIIILNEISQLILKSDKQKEIINGITELSRNLADPEQFRIGRYDTTGGYASISDYVNIGLIAVEQGREYFASTIKGLFTNSIFWFDEQRNFLSYASKNYDNPIISIPGAAFFSANIQRGSSSLEEIQKSVMISVDGRYSYEPPISFKKNLIENIINEKITSNLGDSEELAQSQKFINEFHKTVLVKGVNEIDLEKIIIDKYTGTSGTIGSGAYYGIIMHQCDPAVEYSMYSTAGATIFTQAVFFFDENQNFIAPYLNLPSTARETFTTPSNCHFVSRNVPQANISLELLKETLVFKKGLPLENGWLGKYALNPQLVSEISVNSTIGRETINIENVTQILFVGTSHCEGLGSVKDKAMVSYVSALLDWNVINFGWSGNDYIKNFNCIQNSQTRFGITPLVDCKNGGICLDFTASSAENGYYSRGIDARHSEDNMIRLYSLLRSLGFDIICCSYWGDQTQPMGLWQRDVAKRFGYQYVDINAAITRVNQKNYLSWWYLGHFASRTVANQYHYLLRAINLPRPRTALKIFRNRIQSSELSDFLFDNNYEKMRAWREISINHRSIPFEYENYVDRLDLLVDAPDYSVLRVVYDEYVNFRKTKILSIEDKALIQFTFPATANDIKNLEITLDTNKQKNVYVRKYSDTSLSINLENAKAIFRLTIVPNDIVPSDIFLDSGNPEIIFTTFAIETNQLLCTPSMKFEAVGQTSGILTRTSDNKQYTYTAIYTAPSADYFNHVFKAKGAWKLIQEIDGVYNLSTAVCYMDYDRIDILVVGSEAFNFTKIECSFDKSKKEKVYNLRSETNSLTLQTFKNQSIIDEKTFINVGQQGSNWILINTSENSFLWNGIVDFPIISDGISIERQHISSYYFSLGATQILHLKQGDIVKQNVLIVNSELDSKIFKLKLVARYYPIENIDMQNPSITSDTFDFARLGIRIKVMDSTNCYTKILYIPASFVELEEEFYFNMPNKLSMNTIELIAIDDRIELLYFDILE